MSKAWQDFWTMAFLAVAYVFTIIMCLRLLRRDDVSEGVKARAGIVLFLWIIAIPALIFYLGAAPDLLRILAAPFKG